MNTHASDTAGSPLSVREHKTLEEFRALEPVWDSLLKRCGTRSLYMTFEWLWTWWACLGGGKRSLKILSVFDGVQIVGIAPFVEVRRRWMGIPYETIEFLSARDYAFSSLTMSGILDIIAPSQSDDVLEAIMRYLVQLPSRWIYLRLDCLVEEGICLSRFRRLALRHGLRPAEGASDLAYEIGFEGGWDGYVKAKGAPWHTRLRSLERRLGRRGHLEWEDIRSSGDPDRIVRSIMDVERNSWKWTRGMSINARGYGGFYERFLRVASDAGWLRLTLLKFDGQPVAYWYSVIFDGTVEALKTAFVRSLKRFSAGQIAQHHHVQWAAREGVQMLNLHIGAKEYKSKWSTRTRTYGELFLLRDTARARLLCLFLFTFRFYGRFRFLPDLSKRVIRRLGFAPRWSELTRMDQA